MSRAAEYILGEIFLLSFFFKILNIYFFFLDISRFLTDGQAFILLLLPLPLLLDPLARQDVTMDGNGNSFWFFKQFF